MPRKTTKYINVNIDDAVQLCKRYMLHSRKKCRFTEHDMIARVKLSHPNISAASCSAIWDTLQTDRLLYFDKDAQMISLALFLDMKKIHTHLKSLSSSSPRLVPIKGAGSQFLMTYIERFGYHFQLKIQDQANRMITLSDDTGYVDAHRLQNTLKSLTGGMSLYSYAKQSPVDIIKNQRRDIHIDSFMPFDHEDSQRVFYIPNVDDKISKEEKKTCTDEWDCYCAFFGPE